MQVTSDCLFHFTDSLKNLEMILSKKFQLTYCNEIYTLNGENHNSYFPMISFCDLPLSLTKNHIYKYGCFAIGLSKDWGIKNKLNPVIYLEKDSLVASDMKIATDSLSSLLKTYEDIYKKNPDKRTELKLLLVDIKKTVECNLNYLRYIKNYQGELVRKGKVIDKSYRFYDEREWRYVPSFNDNRIQTHLNEESYKAYRGTSPSKPLIESIVLNFTAKDIKYLIVKSSADIPKLISLIKRTNELTSNPDEADILTTKILTVDQLNTDF